jgi:hypothetical protein
LTPIEISFSTSDVSNNKYHKEEESKWKIGDIIPMNIRTQEHPKVLKIGSQCSEEEKKKMMYLFREFRDVFSWAYEDLCGFDPSFIQHAILIKEEAKLVRKKQRPINPTLEATIRKEVDKLINAHIIFLVKYSQWVSNLVPMWKKNGDIPLFVDFHELNTASVKDEFPLPNMEMIL